MPRHNLSSLKNYSKFLSSKTIPFPCPRCQQSVLPKLFEKHCTQHHTLNTRLQCAWCFGGKSWNPKSKCLHTDHLLWCCRKFLKSNVPTRPPVQSNFDRSPLCPARDLFGRTWDPQLGAYASISLLSLPKPRIPYDLDSLNTASACIQYYLDNRDRTEFNHIIVRSVAFQSFLKAMDESTTTHTLPFSTWCDGGHYAQDRHRHFITVSPKDQFVSSVWSKVKIAKNDRPHKNFRCIHKKPIKTPMHLLNTLGYLSQSESSCEFAGTKVKRTHHYYIFETLPKDYRHALCVLWPEGQRELLDQEFHNLKWDELLRSNLVFHHQQWHLRVKDIPRIRFGMDIPFTLRYSSRPTHLFVHLLNNEKIYFRRGTPLLPTFFYDSVRDSFWTLRPFYQRLVNTFKFFTEWKTQQEQATRMGDDWKEKYERKQINTLNDQEKYQALHEKNQELHEKNQELHNKIHHLNDVEIVRLHQTITTLEAKIDELKKENAELKKKKR